MFAVLLSSALLAVVCSGTARVSEAEAHQDGCHRWHSCPSDSGSYVCGDTGYASECGGTLPDIEEPVPDPLYDYPSDTGADDADAGNGIAPEPPPVDVNADKRHRAQAKLAAAQSQLNTTLAQLFGARAAVNRLTPVFHRTRRRAEATARKAKKAGAAASVGRESMASGRKAAVVRVSAARTAYRVERSQWSSDRARGEASAVVLLLLAATLAVWWRTLGLVGLLRVRGWSGGRYAKFAAALIAAIAAAVAIALSAAGLPAAGAVNVLVLGLIFLAWLAWRASRPGARFVLRRVVTSSALAAVLAVLAVATLGSALSTAAPAAPVIDEATLSLARVGVTPYEHPTADVARLQKLADKRKRAAGKAADGADTAAAAYQAATAKVTSLEAGEQAARASIDRLNARIRKLAPRYESAGGTGNSDVCDPSYVGECLDPNSLDYDCAGGSGDGPDYTGFVEVVGDDPYDLDRDGDGFACEW